MAEKIESNLYKIKIPLPSGDHQFINSYIIKSNLRNLIIDPGLGTDECMRIMTENLSELDIDLNKTDFFITHSHRDHLGLVPRLMQNGSVINISRLEAENIHRIESGELEEEIIDFIFASGFPEKKMKDVLSFRQRHEPMKSRSMAFNYVTDGDSLNIDEYSFICVKSPGHSSGHMCLYESRRRILIAGDHLLGDITPGIQGRFNDTDALSDYLQSLDSIDKLEIEIVLPGHGNIFRNCKERIGQLRLHHRERVQEVIELLRKSSGNAYQIASRMTWNVGGDSWDSLPVMQQYFATGEAVAHLKYILKQGLIKIEMDDKRPIYMLEN
ncbi:MAG: MBL fold metallo-hydrolase [Spirochaetes bacterium]|nr:MBL fold metallo-hydrolase [Spirochaetota bacterium]